MGPNSVSIEFICPNVAPSLPSEVQMRFYYPGFVLRCNSNRIRTSGRTYAVA
jgi:hypothetical protein